MKSHPDNTNYKALNITLVVVLTTAAIYITFLKKKSTHNYIYASSFDLFNHDISQNEFSNKKIALFLGTSSMAGSNVPIRTTVSDQFNKQLENWVSFNLAKPVSDMATVIVYYQLALKYTKPDLLIVGVVPEIFPEQIGINPVLAYYSEIFSTIHEQEIYNYLKNQSINKGYFFLPIQAKIGATPPTEIQLKISSFLYNIRKLIFGDLHSKNIYSLKQDINNNSFGEKNQNIKLVSTLKRLADKHNSRIVFYFEPEFKGIKFERQLKDTFKDNLSKVFREYHITYLDYSDLLNSSPEYFIDYIHVTPKGHRIIVEQLISDLGLKDTKQ